MVRVAVGAVEAVVGCPSGHGDGDVLRLLFPLLFDLNWWEEEGQFGDGRCGPVRLLGLRQRSDGGRGRGGGKAAVSLGV